MPMLAHFEDLAPKSDRRRYIRRALKLGTDAGGDGVTVHDLSLTGALLETSVPMLVGAIFDVELPEIGKVEATVVWNSGEFYGCQFDLPISPAALSAAQLRSQPQFEVARGSADPVAELQELNAEVERLALMMESALKRLTRR
jgi:PilZ domain-containing protein